jgi:hypothetical protein
MQKLSKHFIDGHLQIRQIILNNIPNSFQIDAQIIVDQHIPETSVLVPFHLGMILLHGFRDPHGRLRQHLQIV